MDYECFLVCCDRLEYEMNRSESYVTTDGQSASLSWNKAPIWGLRPDFCYCQTVAGLLMWGALSDERTGLSFTIAAGTRQRSHSRIRVPRDSWPHFTISYSGLPVSSPPVTRLHTGWLPILNPESCFFALLRIYSSSYPWKSSVACSYPWKPLLNLRWHQTCLPNRCPAMDYFVSIDCSGNVLTELLSSHGHIRHNIHIWLFCDFYILWKYCNHLYRNCLQLWNVSAFEDRKVITVVLRECVCVYIVTCIAR
jgi:hypothetical protein